jgi:hypothetical protein
MRLVRYLLPACTKELGAVDKPPAAHTEAPPLICSCVEPPSMCIHQIVIFKVPITLRRHHYREKSGEVEAVSKGSTVDTL